jgi:uncharacterized integral membrane protein (TIGR00698 family)
VGEPLVNRWWVKAVFASAGVAAAGPWSRTDIALLAGIVLAVVGWTAWGPACRSLSRWLIQACVVALGLRLDLRDLARAAADGLGLAIVTILGALALGIVLARALRTGREVGVLVSSGTAICGGSAIAAVGGAIGAAATSIAVATAAIFVLNAIGLWTLPPIGHALNLSEAEFGTWAGVALHDIASVGGAAGGYHSAGAGAPVALDTANVVKLVRVVWIFPLAIGMGWWFAGRGGAGGRPAFPWFILGFVAASAISSTGVVPADVATGVAAAAKVGFQAALFLIGAGLSVSALRAVGWRALAQAALLWIIVAGGTLAWVCWSR